MASLGAMRLLLMKSVSSKFRAKSSCAPGMNSLVAFSNWELNGMRNENAMLL